MNTESTEPKFICEKYHLTMPADKQQEFCARRFLKALDGDFCLECEHGKKAGKDRRETGGGKSFGNDKKKEVFMPTPTKIKECIDCKQEYKPTSNVQKRCPECKAKKTAAPAKHRPGQARKSASSGKKGRVNGKAARSGKCEDCELARVEKVMIAAGIVSAEKFEQAREIVRELAK